VERGKSKADTKGPVIDNELSGKILLPGVYHNANLGLAAGGVATLDAKNDANAVFILKWIALSSTRALFFFPAGLIWSTAPGQKRLVRGRRGSDHRIWDDLERERPGWRDCHHQGRLDSEWQSIGGRSRGRFDYLDRRGLAIEDHHQRTK